LRIPRRPNAPTKDEIEQHEITNFPPRDWCQHCVDGHGISHQHKRVEEEEKLGITVSLDYAFMTADETEEGVSPILVMHDNSTGAIWVLAVERKGNEPVALNWAVARLDEAGYRGTKVSLKSDQEE